MFNALLTRHRHTDLEARSHAERRASTEQAALAAAASMLQNKSLLLNFCHIQWGSIVFIREE